MIKRITETDDDGYTYSINFAYNENQLIAVSDSENYNAKLVYSSGFLTRVENYEDSQLVEYITYSYDVNNNLESYTIFYEGAGLEGTVYRHDLSVNSNNTIEETVYRGTAETQTELLYTITKTVSNGNITSQSSDISDDVYLYEFDLKNSAYRNIYAIQLLELSTSATESGFTFHGNNNNIVKIIDDQSSFSTDEDRFDYNYNSDGYPISATYGYYCDGQLQYEANLQYEYY